MTAVIGTDRSLWREEIGFFPPGTPLASDVGLDAAGRRAT
jgi:peptide/nickel transport system substrate-binding protein